MPSFALQVQARREAARREQMQREQVRD